MQAGTSPSSMSLSTKFTKEIRTRDASVSGWVPTLPVITFKISTFRVSMKRDHRYQFVEKEVGWQQVNLSLRNLHETHQEEVKCDN